MKTRGGMNVGLHNTGKRYSGNRFGGPTPGGNALDTHGQPEGLMGGSPVPPERHRRLG
jgi:hypothetical protein